MNWYLEAFKKYAVFSGRARRKEFWMFGLFNFLVSLVLVIIDNVVGYPVLTPLYGLASLLPSLGLSIRRLHDTGRSGWWILFSLVPLVGAIVLFVFSVLDGDQQENQYGPNPKQPAAY
ncbi:MULTISPECIES: DUF805 domain-containing protein [unclassified Streptomyces]|uniref:DUF805 domain-containing protein n=1 Tax=unclassified Streptomyces TaxID=2593676 RepID=UPI0016601A79|nr:MULTISPECIES: DUF805 domain-containing protein [unclassified Streptomyces]MBD0708704.1 hypothetical protein [Streptomyces sp. CBMA291]MBD0714563.1 hypothetical protein [Streptomyces sp. CBMA370]